MSEKPTEMDTIDTMARALTAALPAGWREVSATYRVTAPYAELDASVVNAAGQSEQVDPLPDGLEGQFETLRLQMYQPGRGAWLTASLTITRAGRFSTDFDYEGEPSWSIPVSAEIYATDLAEFPREDEYIPAWLREKARNPR
ncbi:hypothetical protein FB561_3693 [Kribbella amoyensis]|uniref:DUF600 family protein n=1 Tax=Kribbella amoyensis TaxID=996641 RepID=A0A561BUG4_9ACTN|nr:hypothetical protein [Kribbella amoyensis]TWD82560.1 hypothetical protein FB561_3693 [Kribbella amoyensis]